VREQGVDRDALIQAVERDGLRKKRAQSAVSNWLTGRDHPRCTAKDIAAMANVLGVAPKDIARFTSTAKYVRSSPRKSALLADLIRDKPIVQAINDLSFSKRRAAKFVLKALEAAQADAESADADVNALVVAESRVDEGPTIKRFQPKDRGRAHPIMKRTSHIVVGLEEVA
jgi:large subunit ribosomal protein L22